MPQINLDVYSETHGSEAKLKDVETAMKGVTDSSDTADQKLGGLWKQMTAGVLAAGGIEKAARLVVDVFVDSIKEAAEYERAMKGLNAAFDISGRTMPGMARGLKDYADQMQALGLADDAAILKVESLLLQLTNLDEKGIKAATRGAIGLASVFGMDLTNAAEAVAKGMEGNYMALGRMIPAIRNATGGGEKQAAMMKAFEDLYARAIADTDTYSGQVKILGLEWGETKKMFGEALLGTGALQDGVEATTEALKAARDMVLGHGEEIKKEIEVQNKRYEILKTVTSQMGMSGLALANLIIKHDGLTESTGQGTLATYQFIKAGGLGEEAVKLLAKAEADHIEKLKDQKKGYTETGTAAKVWHDILKNSLIPQVRSLAGYEMIAIENLKGWKDAVYAEAVPAARDLQKAVKDVSDTLNDQEYTYAADTKAELATSYTYWDQFMDDVQTAWSENFVEFFKGDRSLLETFENMFNAVLDSFIKLLADMLAKWLVSEIFGDLGGIFNFKSQTVPGLGGGVTPPGGGGGVTPPGGGGYGSSYVFDLTILNNLTKEIHDWDREVHDWLLTEYWPVAYTVRDAMVDSLGVLRGCESKLVTIRDSILNLEMVS